MHSAYWKFFKPYPVRLAFSIRLFAQREALRIQKHFEFDRGLRAPGQSISVALALRTSGQRSLWQSMLWSRGPRSRKASGPKATGAGASEARTKDTQ